MTIFRFSPLPPNKIPPLSMSSGFEENEIKVRALRRSFLIDNPKSTNFRQQYPHSKFGPRLDIFMGGQFT